MTIKRPLTISASLMTMAALTVSLNKYPFRSIFCMRG